MCEVWKEIFAQNFLAPPNLFLATFLPQIIIKYAILGIIEAAFGIS
jgi:hypothetical protein